MIRYENKANIQLVQLLYLVKYPITLIISISNDKLTLNNGKETQDKVIYT